MTPDQQSTVRSLGYGEPQGEEQLEDGAVLLRFQSGRRIKMDRWGAPINENGREVQCW